MNGYCSDALQPGTCAVNTVLQFVELFVREICGPATAPGPTRPMEPTFFEDDFPRLHKSRNRQASGRTRRRLTMDCQSLRDTALNATFYGRYSAVNWARYTAARLAAGLLCHDDVTG